MGQRVYIPPNYASATNRVLAIERRTDGVYLEIRSNTTTAWLNIVVTEEDFANAVMLAFQESEVE